MLDTLGRRQLIVVTGKGGVGKTTIAAGLARLLAEAGRRVLLLEVDPRESMHQLLGTEPSGGAILKVSTRLSVQNLQPKAVVESLVREKVRIPVLAKKIVASPVFQHFAEGTPGLKEMSILGYAQRTVAGDYRHKADIVVLDAPATGHGVSMLAAPLLLGDLVGGGQIGDMSKSLAQFVADPARCGVVLTTLAEEMPVQELAELIALLEERIGRPPELVVANGLYPEYPGGKAGKRESGQQDEVIALWREWRAVNDRELARLGQLWDGPRAEVPLLPLERGPKLLEAVAACLAQEIG